MELNQSAWALQYEIEANSEFSPEIMAATLYGRIISIYQMALMISEKGMLAQSYTLIRCLLEPLFPLVAISKDHQFAHLLINSDEIESKIDTVLADLQISSLKHAYPEDLSGVKNNEWQSQEP